MIDLDPGSCAFMAALFIGAAMTAMLATLKLCGVLLLSWWVIASVIPVGIIAFVLAVGCFAIFGK